MVLDPSSLSRLRPQAARTRYKPPALHTVQIPDLQKYISKIKWFLFMLLSLGNLIMQQ